MPVTHSEVMIMARNQVRLDIERREPFAGGGSFGNTGPYERLFGQAHFAIDPDEKGLPSIVDLDLAPRNAQGLVEFAATLDIIKPVEPGRGNRRILYEFSNRGNRGLLGFNYSRGVDMSKPEYAGDGFLMRQGYSLIWSGWQGDLIDRGDNVVAYLPLALRDGKPLRGRVRQEFNPMAEGILSMGVSAGAERGQDVQPYPVLDRSTATLTMRHYESDPRVPVPDSEWELAKAEVKDGEVVLTPSNIDLYIKGGFKPGWIYEFIYETEGSRVMNLGFLGIRDLLSLLRYETHDAAGTPNPLAGHVEKVYGTGASLSGRVSANTSMRAGTSMRQAGAFSMRCIRTPAVAACFRTSASPRSVATHVSTKSISGQPSTTPSPISPSPTRLPIAMRVFGSGPRPTRSLSTCTPKVTIGCATCR
jgi:hypothetical protein